MGSIIIPWSIIGTHKVGGTHSNKVGGTLWEVIHSNKVGKYLIILINYLSVSDNILTGQESTIINSSGYK